MPNRPTKVQFTPRRRPWLLCVKVGTAKAEVKQMVRDMVVMMSVPSPLRDIEIRFIRPMTLGIDNRLLELED